MTEKRESAQNGKALNNHLSRSYIERAKRAADFSIWQPVALQDAVAAYARRSSDVDNESIERQDQRSDEYARHKLKKEVSYRYSDEGISGETSFRPGLEALLRDARVGKFKILIVEDVDRVGRRLGVIGAVFDELEDLGIEIHSLFKEDKLHKQDVILKTLAATENQTQLRHRIGGSKAVALSKGRIVSKMPYGYIRDPYVRGQYRADPAIKDAIAWAFEARRTGLSSDMIYDGMKEMIDEPELYPSDRYMVVRMLHNPIYKGVYIYGRKVAKRIRGRMTRYWAHPDQWTVRHFENLQIVDAQLWEDVNNTYSQTPRKLAVKRLLTSKVFCTRCGSSLTACNFVPGSPVYTCRAKGCIGTITATRLEGAAMEAIGELLGTEGLEDIFQAMLDQEIGKQRIAVEERRAQLTRLHANKKAELDLEIAVYKKIFLEAQAKDMELPAFMSERTGQMTEDIDILESRLKALPDLTKRILVTGAKRKRLLEVFRGMSDLIDKRAHDYSSFELVNIGLMRDLIDRVDVGLVEGSRSYLVAIHVSTPAMVGLEGVELPLGEGTRSFRTRIHRWKGNIREPEVLRAFEEKVHFLSDVEFEKVCVRFCEELDALVAHTSSGYGIRKALDLAAFVCSTSLARRMLRRCGIETSRAALALTRELFSSGTWARIAAVLEEEFPRRRGTFNLDMPRRFNAADQH